MKKQWRVLPAMLALLLCLGPLSGCRNNGEEPAGSLPPSTDVGTPADTGGGNDTPGPAGEVVIAADRKIHYGIVYAEGCGSTIQESVTYLYDAIKKRSDGGVTTVEAVEYGAENDPDALQILIGDVGTPESNAVMEAIGYGDWTVRFSGNKLVVAAYSEYALDSAITELIQQIKQHAGEDGSIVFPSDLSVTDTFDETANHLPVYDSARAAQTIPEGDNTSLAVIRGTDMEEYDRYLLKLETLGYRYHTGNVIGENCFATYYNDDYVIHAGFYAYESAARVTVEKKTALVGLEEENIYTPQDGMTTKLSMMGLSVASSGYAGNGMAYVMQLADGSLILIDGGFYSSADRLYAYLRTLVPEGKITIAAWIITHNDGDHSQCMASFLPRYGEEVVLEQVIANFPHSYGYLDSGTNENSAPLSAARATGCKVIKAHTGQKFYIRNAEVEILYSLDSYLPETLSIFNNSSLVFTVEAEGERMLFTGDASDEAAEILTNMYGDYMKSDILQLAHHGLRNGHGLNMPNTVELYGIVRPEVGLWPTSWEAYLNTENQTEDYQMAIFTWNCMATDGAREVYIAGGEEVTVLTLPYRSFSALRLTEGYLSAGGDRPDDDLPEADWNDPDAFV